MLFRQSELWWGWRVEPLGLQYQLNLYDIFYETVVYYSGVSKHVLWIAIGHNLFWTSLEMKILNFQIIHLVTLLPLPPATHSQLLVLALTLLFSCERQLIRSSVQTTDVYVCFNSFKLMHSHSELTIVDEFICFAIFCSNYSLPNIFSCFLLCKYSIEGLQYL